MPCVLSTTGAAPILGAIMGMPWVLSTTGGTPVPRSLTGAVIGLTASGFAFTGPGRGPPVVAPLGFINGLAVTGLTAGGFAFTGPGRGPPVVAPLGFTNGLAVTGLTAGGAAKGLAFVFMFNTPFQCQVHRSSTRVHCLGSSSFLPLPQTASWHDGASSLRIVLQTASRRSS